METTAQPVILSKERKLEILTQLLDQASGITSNYYTEPRFNSWKISVEIALTKIFGENSPQLAAFRKLKFYSPSSSYSYEGNETANNHAVVFKRDFETTKLFLTQFKDSIEMHEEAGPVTKEHLPKIQWQGTQKELAELFIELRNKGWIKEINSDLIQRYFAKSETIKQVLKPSKDKTGTANYDGVYTKTYKPSFDLIKSNTKES